MQTLLPLQLRVSFFRIAHLTAYLRGRVLAAVVGSIDGDGGAGVGDDQRTRGLAQRPMPQLLGDVVDRGARELLGLVSLSTFNVQINVFE